MPINESGETPRKASKKFRADIMLTTDHTVSDGIWTRIARKETTFPAFSDPDEKFMEYHALSVRAIPGVVTWEEDRLNRYLLNFYPCKECPLRQVMEDGSIRGPLECPSCEDGPTVFDPQH